VARTRTASEITPALIHQEKADAPKIEDGLLGIPLMEVVPAYISKSPHVPV
jgi:hypothetical protein